MLFPVIMCRTQSSITKISVFYYHAFIDDIVWKFWSFGIQFFINLTFYYTNSARNKLLWVHKYLIYLCATWLKMYFAREMPLNVIFPVKTLNKFEIVYVKVFRCLRSNKAICLLAKWLIALKDSIFISIYKGRFLKESQKYFKFCTK